MAVPKRRTSKARRNSRRAHWKAKPPKLVECPQCGELKVPHRVCIRCGTYKGREIVRAKK